MENAGDVCPVGKVLGNTDLVEDIVQRVGSSLSMIRCRAVNCTWRAATRTPSFARSFGERTKQANVGFIVDFKQGGTRLLYPLPSDGHETEDFMRSRVDETVLGGDKVLGCIDGVMLTLGGEGGANPNIFHTSCLWDSPRVYTAVAGVMPRIQMNLEQRTVNTFGQYGVLPEAGLSGMSFFIKDAARNFICTYAGVSFCSDEPICVHVNVHTNGNWVRSVSNPIPSPATALFHRNPYSVLDGEKLYMMYLVDYIVCFNLGSREFSQIPLPADLGQKVTSWYDYTVAPRLSGGLVLVQCKQGMLDKWVLSHTSNAAVWNLEKTVDLVLSFGNRFPILCWTRVIFREAFPIAADDFYSVQVRSASRDASFVFLTVGFESGMYEIDMARESVRELNNYHRDGNIGTVYHVAEAWPLVAAE